jgi:uroporphyrinogen decarboxylase
MKKIAAELKKYNVPVTLFSKGGIELAKQLADSEASMIGIDWMTDLQEAKNLLGHKFALQGNLDPTTLYGSHDIITKEVKRVLNVFGAESGHVFNLGHGILPDIPVDNVYHLVESLREISTDLHS